jgi:hypothetical protein
MCEEAVARQMRARPLELLADVFQTVVRVHPDADASLAVEDY